MPTSRARAAVLFFLLAGALADLAAQSQSQNEIIKLEANASYYGKEFDGRPTSSGEIFDMNAMTAAHKSLPFGTLLEVTNLANGKRVTVRVNDRGPFVANREIDLSFGAAAALDMISAGIAKVSIRKIGMGASAGAAAAGALDESAPASNGAPKMESTASTWKIQIASFSTGENAERMAVRLRSEGFEPQFEEAGAYIRVVLTGIRGSELEVMKARLSDRGYRDWLTKREAP